MTTIDKNPESQVTKLQLNTSSFVKSRLIWRGWKERLLFKPCKAIFCLTQGNGSKVTVSKWLFINYCSWFSSSCDCFISLNVIIVTISLKLIPNNTLTLHRCVLEISRHIFLCSSNYLKQLCFSFQIFSSRHHTGSRLSLLITLNIKNTF